MAQLIILTVSRVGHFTTCSWLTEAGVPMRSHACYMCFVFSFLSLALAFLFVQWPLNQMHFSSMINPPPDRRVTSRACTAFYVDWRGFSPHNGFILKDSQHTLSNCERSGHVGPRQTRSRRHIRAPLVSWLKRATWKDSVVDLLMGNGRAVNWSRDSAGVPSVEPWGLRWHLCREWL